MLDYFHNDKLIDEMICRASRDKPSWRNWIAHRTSNPGVVSSSLTVGVSFLNSLVVVFLMHGQFSNDTPISIIISL